jgi:hypothetical protein
MNTDDTSPGLLYRLSVFEANHAMVRGWPKIYATEAGLKAAISALRNASLPGRYWIREGCARGPWLNLEGPVVPEVRYDVLETP